MSDDHLSGCHCCESQQPRPAIYNDPGLPALAWRIDSLAVLMLLMMMMYLWYHLIEDEMQLHKDNDEKELKKDDVDELQLQQQQQQLMMDALKENVNDQVKFDLTVY